MKHSPAISRVAIAAVLLFLLLLLTLHFLEPEFDPSTRLISEYELGRYGWIMSLAFFSLAVSVGGMLLSTWSLPRTRAGLIGRWWFVAIAVALIGAGIFYPSTAPRISSLIHGVCGIIVIATFPIAATLYSAGTGQPQGLATARPLQRATLLVWVGFLSFVGSLVVFGIMTPQAARSTASLSIGWQNRFMIITYALWLVVVVTQALSVKSEGGSDR